MKELNLQEIQQASLHVLDEIDRICKEQGLTYYLAFGTLIGAMRHKGFIPWDDDVDIMMPRESYDRLAEYFETHDTGKLRLCNRKNTDYYVYSIFRICDMNYKFENFAEHEVGYDGGAFIDVYPLDHCGDTVEHGTRIYRKIDIMNQFYISYVKPYAKTKWYRKPLKYMAWLQIKLFKGDKKYRYRIDDKIREIIDRNFKDTDKYIGVVSWDTTFAYWPAEYFDETMLVEFEGRQFMAPARADEVLTHYYGDYMQLPPVEARKPQHSYRLYVRE